MKYFLILIPIIFIILLILPVKIRFKYTLIGNKMYFKISFSYLLGIFSPELYPLEKKNKTKKSNSKDFKTFKNIVKELEYVELMKYIWNKLKIEKLEFETTIGTTNPFVSAMLYGLVWNIVGTITGYLFMYKNIEKLDIDILPIFEENRLDIKFDCIIKIKIVHIINTLIKSIKLYKGGVKNVRTSNRRINEIYNE